MVVSDLFLKFHSVISNYSVISNLMGPSSFDQSDRCIFCSFIRAWCTWNLLEVSQNIRKFSFCKNFAGWLWVLFTHISETPAIDGEIEDGAAEDRDMDLPLQYKRWKARMTKQGKAKQAHVYFKKNIVLMSEKRGLGGVKGAADTLDRGYRTNYRSFCNWKHTIYRWRYEFKKHML